jgi:3-dehydroquinate synthase
MDKIVVPLKERSYPIWIGEESLSALPSEAQRLKFGSRCVIVTDSNVAPLFSDSLAQQFRSAGFDPLIYAFPAGESSKNLKIVEKGYAFFAQHRLERKSFVVALGGGVVGDLAGFLAATYLRGIGFLQAPTTLLAQVDSSVGGKVGVNLPSGKNLVGAFYQPGAVACDLSALRALPEREFRAGIAEIIKYGIIYDPALFDYLERNVQPLLARESSVVAHVVKCSCEIKGEVVGQDETEGGLRAILNYGHTIGHALEAISSYNVYLHGEAISIGQVAASHLSAMQLGLNDESVQRIRNLFQAFGLPTELNLTSAKTEKLFQAMALDKKVSAGEVKFVLAERIGKVVWGQKVSRQQIELALAKLKPSKTQPAKV